MKIDVWPDFLVAGDQVLDVTDGDVGRLALITGASRRIGAATALVLAKHGYRVVASGCIGADAPMQSLAADDVAAAAARVSRGFAGVYHVRP